MLIPRSEIDAARSRIQPYLAATPLYRSATFSSWLNADLMLKLETLQPTHSFKVRGAANATLALDEEERTRGLITASGGNHGLALAYIAHRLGNSATVYLPRATPQVKVDAIRALNAEIVLHGDAWDDANRLALEVAAHSGRIYIHPFDNPYMMAGAATIVAELMEQGEPPDAIVVSVGGGGLIAGIISAVRRLSPHTRVYGVETIGADSMSQSLHAGNVVELPAMTSIAESLGARRPGELPFQLVRDYAEDLVTVTDAEAMAAVVELLNREKLLAEPATTCCLAALTLGKIPVRPGERVVVILCGANVALTRVCRWLVQ